MVLREAEAPLPCSMSRSLSASSSRSLMTALAASWWKVSLHTSSSCPSRSRRSAGRSKVISHCMGSPPCSPFTTALQEARGERGDPRVAPESQSWGSQSDEVSVSSVKDRCWAASGSPGLRLSDEDCRLASSSPEAHPTATSGAGGDVGQWQGDTWLCCSREGRRAPALQIQAVEMRGVAAKGWKCTGCSSGLSCCRSCSWVLRRGFLSNALPGSLAVGSLGRGWRSEIWLALYARLLQDAFASKPSWRRQRVS